MSRLRRFDSWRAQPVGAFATVLGTAACAACVALAQSPAPSTAPSLAELRAAFARPSAVPVPADNVPNQARIELGRRLFNETRLSVDGSTSCASCHIPELSFSDGVDRGQGIAKQKLARHTPSLWNIAWSPVLFWDGRARSLEEQARGPIESPLEMGQALTLGAERLSADPSYVQAFASANPIAKGIGPETIVRALASYERTLVSPLTRFDRWVAGDDAALTEVEINGFRLFNGKAACATCHSGWAFTDYSFHDIGLPGDDPGRGVIVSVERLTHAFKTPSLRELSWTAPYMHDGSLGTLDDVLAHYEHGVIRRPSRSRELPPRLDLSRGERDDLLAFLECLSSERPPRPQPIPGFGASTDEPRGPTVSTNSVSQRNKQFQPNAIRLKAGQTLTVVNDDTRPHNVRLYDPRGEFNSGLQEPGDSAIVPFPKAGAFEVFCGIHPNMRLKVEVE